MSALPMTLANIDDIDNCQINPSCLLAYLGIRGIGINEEASLRTREFNFIPIAGYWDIVKHYYSNKQEEIGAVIHTIEAAPTAQTITSINFLKPTGSPSFSVNQKPTLTYPTELMDEWQIQVDYTGTAPDPEQIYIYFKNNGPGS